MVYESTVYPNCIGRKCAPLLERELGLKYNKDYIYRGWIHKLYRELRLKKNLR